MATIVKVPYLGTAEEDVLLSEWVVAEGSAFRKGDTLAVVETLKASFEVEAESEGVLLRHLVNAGTRVALQAPIGVAGAADEALDENELARMVEEQAPGPGSDATELQPQDSAARSRAASTPTGEATAAPAARRMAAERGIDLASIQGTGPEGLVRVEDVERAVAGGGPRVSADGRVDASFLDHVRANAGTFGALDSDFKVALYRAHGARIGEGATIGPGALLLVDHLELGAGAFFGAGTRVEAKELVAGELLHLGARCRVRCTRLEIGDNAFFADDVEVGGGGAFDPEAELVVGSHGFVGEHVHLNPCRRLQIGDEVVVSRGAVVMTHSFGGSILAGYPNRFAGVRLGERSQVGIQASLFPGTEMGAGSILLSGSALVSSVPAGKLYGGVPATELKDAAKTPDDEGFVSLARELVREFERQMRLRGRETTLVDEGGELSLSIANAGAVHRLRFRADGALAEPAETLAEEVRVHPRLADDAWESQPADVVAIDLAVPRIRGVQGPLADAFREFLRKRGVRLRPRSWTYRGGWL